MKNTSLRRLAASAGILTLAMTAAGIGAASATPDPVNPPPGQAQDLLGSINIHKLAGAQDPAKTNGTHDASAQGDPLPGVTFGAQLIGSVNDANQCVALDLTTTAGWTAAQKANGPKPTAPVADPAAAAVGDLCIAGTLEAQKTNGSGLAAFTDLELGLYYVQETAAPDNVIDSAVPFYVTVPFASKSGTGDTATSTWLYDVHVYPKNTVAGAPVKEIAGAPDGLVTGSAVTWSITQQIPKLSGATDTFTQASVADTLDPRLALASQSIKIVDSSGGTPVEVAFADGDVTFAQNDKALTWTLNEGGLAKLAAHPGSDLVVTVVTTVNGVTAAGDTKAGVIANTGTVTFNTKPQTTPPVYTYWGNLEVTKLHGETPLAGAEFAVFEKDPQAECAATLPAGQALATGTSNATGKVVWTGPNQVATTQGLWITNSNETDPSNNSKAYCLFETAAPAGFIKVNEGFPVIISTTTTAATTFTTFQNTPVDGPDLPLTGSSGTIALTVAGLGLIGLGTAGVLARRSRTSKQH